MVKIEDIEDDIITDFMQSDEGYAFWEHQYAGEMPLTDDNYLAWCESGELDIGDVPLEYSEKWIDDYKKNRKVTNWREEMKNG